MVNPCCRLMLLLFNTSMVTVIVLSWLTWTYVLNTRWKRRMLPWARRVQVQVTTEFLFGYDAALSSEIIWKRRNIHFITVSLFSPRGQCKARISHQNSFLSLHSSEDVQCTLFWVKRWSNTKSLNKILSKIPFKFKTLSINNLKHPFPQAKSCGISWQGAGDPFGEGVCKRWVNNT